MKLNKRSRLISSFLVLLLLVSLVTSTTVTVSATINSSDYLFGDVNGDGTIDFINDVVMVNNYINGYISFSEEQKVLADVNGDNSIDSNDIQALNSVRQSGDFYSLPIYSQLTMAGFCGAEDNNVKYMLKNNGTLIIFGNGKMKDYSSANSVPWYSYRKQIKTGIVKNGVTSICNSAFYQSNVSNVAIPDSIEEIGYYAFFECSSITSISLPSKLKTIEEYTFKRCSRLETITIPFGVQEIQYDAFEQCTGLATINVPGSLSRVQSYAFNDTAWYNNQPDGVVYIGKVVYKYKGDCPSTIELQSNTIGIASSAFSSCNNLTKITIPESVKDIGTSAFSGCNSLTIYGYSNSSAETYAKNYNIPFVRLDEKNLLSISVSKQPIKTNYIVGDSLDTTGLQLKLSYDDGSASYVSSGFTTSGFSSTSTGTKTVTVTYQGKTTTLTVTVRTASNAMITAESVVANPGDTVDLKISLSNNPGIVAATIKVNFDNSVLTLTKVTDAGVLGAQSHKPEYTSPYTLAWANDTATTNYNVNGTIVTLTFKVGNNAVGGKTYPITLSYDYNNYEIYDKDLNPVHFEITSGNINISQSTSEKLLGDVNGDGVVTIIDATFIQSYLVYLQVTTFDEKAADSNGDGAITIVDATFIQRWLAQLNCPYNIGEPIR